MGDPVFRAIFDGLVRRAGGVDAVAALLEARYGVASKGTVSKMCSGQAAISVDAIVAVEDFLQSYQITMRMFERTGHDAGHRGDLRALAARSTVAVGGAHSALFRAYSEMSKDPTRLTPDERAEVIATMREARDAITAIIDAAEVAA